MKSASSPGGVLSPHGGASIERARAAIEQGGQVLLRPAADSDLPPFVVAPADQATPELIAQLSDTGQGQVYLALSDEQCERLRIDVGARPTPSTYNQLEAIDAREGIGAGLSPEDRAHTIRLAASPAASPRDFVSPGHVVPLRACPNGVVERPAPTEAAVDLVSMSGCGQAAVISPLLRATDSTRRDAAAPGTGMIEVTVEDVVAHRWQTDRLVLPDAGAAIPTPSGDFRVVGFKERVSENLHLAFLSGDLAKRKDILVSVHRECLLGSHLRGMTCSCSARLTEAIGRISESGGALIYSQIPARLRDENPLASCADARREAGEAPPATDARDELRVIAQILRELKIETVQWLGDPPVDLPIAGLRITRVLPYAQRAAFTGTAPSRSAGAFLTPQLSSR